MRPRFTSLPPKGPCCIANDLLADPVGEGHLKCKTPQGVAKWACDSLLEKSYPS